MKQFFAGVLLATCLALPASASSIETVDGMITGPEGKSSIITLGAVDACADTACVDASGGDPKMNTASAQQQIASITTPVKKINTEFARKFPDPANPVPSAPADSASSGGSNASVPAAPADSGTIATQPPVQQPMDQASMGAPAEGASTDGTRGTMDPNVPPMPVVNSELRDGE